MIGFWTLLSREVKRFFKVIVQTLVTPFVSSFLYLLVFGVSLGSSVVLKDGTEYLAFQIPGLMMMGLLNNAFQSSSSSIVSAKFSGDLEDLRVSPLTENEIVWAMAIAALIRGLIVALITLFVGEMFYFFQKSHWLMISHPWAVVYFATLSGLIFGFIGISIAFWARTFDQLSAFSAFILLPLTYLGGVFISIDSLHPFWQGVSKLDPLLYLINGLRYGMIGSTDVSLEYAMVLGFVGLLFFYFIAILRLKNGSFQRW